jgi:hypothetical protein
VANGQSVDPTRLTMDELFPNGVELSDSAILRQLDAKRVS